MADEEIGIFETLKSLHEKQKNKESEISQALRKLEGLHKKLGKECPNHPIKASTFEKAFLKSRKKKIKALKLSSFVDDSCSFNDAK